MATVCTELSKIFIDTEFDKYSEKVREKLHKSSVEYGDKSFSMDPVELLGELKEECIDVMGWGMFLFKKLDTIERIYKERLQKPQ